MLRSPESHAEWAGIVVHKKKTGWRTDDELKFDMAMDELWQASSFDKDLWFGLFLLSTTTTIPNNLQWKAGHGLLHPRMEAQPQRGPLIHAPTPFHVDTYICLSAVVVVIKTPYLFHLYLVIPTHLLRFFCNCLQKSKCLMAGMA